MEESKLFERKIQILNEVLELTVSVEFKNNLQDVDIYNELVEKRRLLLEQSKLIDEKLENLKFDENDKHIKEFKKRISGIAVQIIGQDNYMSSTVSRIYQEVKSEFKLAKETRNLNNGYSNAVSIQTSKFDWSK